MNRKVSSAAASGHTWLHSKRAEFKSYVHFSLSLSLSFSHSTFITTTSSLPHFPVLFQNLLSNYAPLKSAGNNGKKVERATGTSKASRASIQDLHERATTNSSEPCFCSHLPTVQTVDYRMQNASSAFTFRSGLKCKRPRGKRYPRFFLSNAFPTFLCTFEPNRKKTNFTNCFVTAKRVEALIHWSFIRSDVLSLPINRQLNVESKREREREREKVQFQFIMY
jgi:hypothetical protein